jgi:hypothetical protein
MSIMKAAGITRHCAVLLCLALLPAATAHADTDPPLPADADMARQQGLMKVISMALHVKPDKDPSAFEACKTWKLTSADVRYFFANAEPIAGEEFHYSYYVMPCEYTGTIELYGETYNFVINAGSYGDLRTIAAPMIARRYGCRHACERLVLLPPDDEEP